jgi:hypothetical protein
MRRHGFIATAFLLAAAPASLAQMRVSGSTDFGAAVLHQPGILNASAVTLGFDGKVSGPRASLAATALGAASAEQGSTGQALITGSLFSPALSGPRWQLAGAVSTFGSAHDFPIVGAQFGAREYFGDLTRGTFVGGSAGTLGRHQEFWPAYTAQAGAWIRHGVDQFLIAAVGTSTRFESHVEIPGIGDVMRTDPAKFVDLSAGWEREQGRLDLSLSGGGRTGIRTLEGWGAGTLTAWMAPHAALVVTAGRSLADVTRGVPQTRYASVAVRFAFDAHEITPAATSPLTSAPSVVLTSLEREVETPRRRLDVRVGARSTVELLADFTQWQPVPLVRVGDVWRLERPIASGPHQLAVRVDGGEWLAPVNLPSAASDFGTKMGLLTVP